MQVFSLGIVLLYYMPVSTLLIPWIDNSLCALGSVITVSLIWHYSDPCGQQFQFLVCSHAQELYILGCLLCTPKMWESSSIYYNLFLIYLTVYLNSLLASLNARWVFQQRKPSTSDHVSMAMSNFEFNTQQPSTMARTQPASVRSLPLIKPNQSNICSGPWYPCWYQNNIRVLRRR